MEHARLAGLDAAPAEFRPWRPQLLLLATTAAATFTLALTLSLSLFLQQGSLGQYEYSLWRWEARNFTSSVLVLVGAAEEVAEGEEAERIATYFGLTSTIRREVQAEEPDRALLETLTNERALHENDVERIIEGFVTEAAVEAGLKRPLPLFSGVRILWPPVNMELTSPPQLLVRSPRDAIRRAGDTLLHSDLTLDEIERIESQTDDEDTVSLVVAIGGLAAYPAVIREDRSYGSVLRLAAHEWVHHYLAFYPLGEVWGRGDGTTLNETVADVAEREIARVAQALHPIELPAGADGRAPAAQAPRPAFGTEMRTLRLEVDALLAEGRVVEAEALMEERRLDLAERGAFIRKINQAYFAFYGSYASLPQSSDPIGPKVERVWEETADLRLFLSLVREIQSVAELDAVLMRLGVDPETVTVE